MEGDARWKEVVVTVCKQSKEIGVFCSEAAGMLTMLSSFRVGARLRTKGGIRPNISLLNVSLQMNISGVDRVIMRNKSPEVGSEALQDFLCLRTTTLPKLPEREILSPHSILKNLIPSQLPRIPQLIQQAPQIHRNRLRIPRPKDRPQAGRSLHNPGHLLPLVSTSVTHLLHI